MNRKIIPLPSLIQHFETWGRLFLYEDCGSFAICKRQDSFKTAALSLVGDYIFERKVDELPVCASDLMAWANDKIVIFSDIDDVLEEAESAAWPVELSLVVAIVSDSWEVLNFNTAKTNVKILDEDSAVIYSNDVSPDLAWETAFFERMEA